MSERKVDREAWAHEVALLIDQEAKGNKSAFARRVGLLSVRNIDRWLAREVNVSEESVRQIARALNLPVVELLIKVGYYRANELPDSSDTASTDQAVAEFVASADDVPPAMRQQILAHLEQMQADQERQRLQTAEHLIEVARRTGQAG